MPRRKWRTRGRRGPLSESLRFRFETGEYPKPGQFPTWAEVWITGSAEYARLWREHGEEIMADWLRDHSGTRPWAWWMFDARESRRCPTGAELVASLVGAWYWRDHFGLPAFAPCRPRGYEGLPEVEGQGAYLQRLGLLLPGERPAPTTLEPEPVDPFHTYEGELDDLRAEYEARRAAGRIGDPSWRGPDEQDDRRTYGH